MLSQINVTNSMRSSGESLNASFNMDCGLNMCAILYAAGVKGNAARLEFGGVF